MSRVCEICGRSYHKANIINKLRGKYNRAGTKKQQVNLKWKKISGKRMKVCTKCIRNLSKVKNSQ